VPAFPFSGGNNPSLKAWGEKGEERPCRPLGLEADDVKSKFTAGGGTAGKSKGAEAPGVVVVMSLSPP